MQIIFVESLQFYLHGRVFPKPKVLQEYFAAHNKCTLNDVRLCKYIINIIIIIIIIIISINNNY